MSFTPYHTSTRQFRDQAEHALEFGRFMDAEESARGALFDYHAAVAKWMRKCGCKDSEISDYRRAYIERRNQGTYSGTELLRARAKRRAPITRAALRRNGRKSRR